MLCSHFALTIEMLLTFMLLPSVPTFARLLVGITMLDACISKFTPYFCIFCSVMSCAISSFYLYNFHTIMYFSRFLVVVSTYWLKFCMGQFSIFSLFCFSNLYSHLSYIFLFIVVCTRCCLLVFLHNVVTFSCQLTTKITYEQAHGDNL